MSGPALGLRRSIEILSRAPIFKQEGARTPTRRRRTRHRRLVALAHSRLTHYWTLVLKCARLFTWPRCWGRSDCPSALVRRSPLAENSPRAVGRRLWMRRRGTHKDIE